MATISLGTFKIFYLTSTHQPPGLLSQELVNRVNSLFHATGTKELCPIDIYCAVATGPAPQAGRPSHSRPASSSLYHTPLLYPLVALNRLAAEVGTDSPLQLRSALADEVAQVLEVVTGSDAELADKVLRRTLQVAVVVRRILVLWSPEVGVG